MLYVVGENIEAGESVVLSFNGKLYKAGPHAGTYLGQAVENLREGFRAYESGCEVREDDA